MGRSLRLFIFVAGMFPLFVLQAQSFNYTASDGNLGSGYSWIDCSPSAGGTEIQDSEWLQDQGLGDKKDDGYAEISWPFNFQFYDSYYFAGDKMYLCTNGFIRFDGIPNDDASDTYKNSINSYSPNLGEIVAFGLEDAGLEASNSNAYYKVTGSAPNRVFTVELNNLEIRFNQNKYLDVQVSFYETSNKIVIKVGNFNISSSNSTYLGIHSGNSSYKDQWGELQSIGQNKWREYTAPAKSSPTITVTQASTASVYPSNNFEILRVQFDISGGSGSFNLTDLDITAQNTNNSDVTNVKLYHTTGTTFNTDHQIGSSVTISGGKYTFSGLGYNMPGGTSYIWVTYDIPSSATSGNTVDGYIAANDITLNGSTYPSSTANPSGSRSISFFKWDGSTSTDWTEPSNWENNAVPSSSDNVYIPSGLSRYPHLPTGNNGNCKNLKIDAGASVTVENSNKNLNIYGDVENNGTLSVTGTYNILLRGTDNVIKGSGDFSTVRFRLRGSNIKYSLETDLSVYRFDIFSSDDNCTLNVNEHTLVCSNRVRNSSSNSTINVTTGSIETGGTFTNDGTFNCGTGTFYYSGSNSQSILNETYYNLKIKVNSGTRTLTNVSSNLTNLELAGSGTAKLDAAIDIDGNIKIGSGVTLDMNGNNINLAKHWTNNGTASVTGTNTVTFDGIGSSHIYGTTNFYNLTINKKYGDVYSDGTNHITNTLTLTKGVVYSSSNTAVIVDAGATISGGGSSSYIDGPLRCDGTVARVFPIGDFRKYAPCALSSHGNAEVVAVYHKEGYTNTSPFNAPLTKVSLNEYWDITPSTSITADLTLYWYDGSWSGIGSLSDLRVAHWNGSAWDNESGTLSTTGNTSSGTIKVTGVSSFSPFTFGTIDNTTNTLPISLLSFDAEAVNHTVELQWKTASEENNDYFIIERSRDGVEVEQIGTVKGAGNSNEILHYNLTDYNPYSGTSYYRLVQVDYNGQSETFAWVAVTVGDQNKPEVSVYPNPWSAGNLNLDLRNFSGDVEIRVVDMAGRILFQQKEMANSEEQNIRLNLNLATGIYNIQIIGQDQQVIKRLIVK